MIRALRLILAVVLLAASLAPGPGSGIAMAHDGADRAASFQAPVHAGASHRVETARDAGSPTAASLSALPPPASEMPPCCLLRARSGAHGSGCAFDCHPAILEAPHVPDAARASVFADGPTRIAAHDARFQFRPPIPV
ncbi:hypothetical protein [Stappia sp.]|uniref:hypothetical protein n=1 Tax=Stappia sp. TaxID=1870903 RepID=UPI0032D9282D